MTSISDKALILFDGVCNLCISSIRFIIARDKNGFFTFSSLQDDKSRQILSELNYHDTDPESIILILNGRIYKKSAAILKIFRHLKGMWRMLYILIVIPEFMRNLVYDFIAKRRYGWFSKREVCYIPGKSIENRFIGESCQR